MRKIFYLLILTGLPYQPAFAQTKDPKTVVELTVNQPSQYVRIRLMYDKYRLLDAQGFTAKISNLLTNKKVRVTGTLVASLVCGSEKTSDFDVTLDPGATQGGAWEDLSGLTSAVSDNDCANSYEKIYNIPADPIAYNQNRIKTLLLRNFRAMIVEDQSTNQTGNTQTNNPVNNSQPANIPAKKDVAPPINSSALQQQIQQNNQRQQVLSEKLAGEDKLVDIGAQAIVSIISAIGNSNHNNDDFIEKRQAAAEYRSQINDLKTKQQQAAILLNDYMNLDRIRLVTAPSAYDKLLAINN
ncbi:MAG: hypothetical protein ACHQIM_22600, partial [Sphingobacteriales bacterium]